MAQNLRAFLQEHASAHQIDAALIDVMNTVADTCVAISSKVRLGDLAGIIGEAGSGNVQGEDQKKLDVIANNMLVEALQGNKHVAGLASEEEDNFVAGNVDGKYLVLFDPLDGSSNIDVNISIGTIFSILPHEGTLELDSFLQAGNQQVASGYALYGPQTLFVLTLRHGVFVFTLNDANEFVLTRDTCQISPSTKEFAINMSNQRHWQSAMQTYVAELLEGKTGKRGKDYNMRWVASMVAEVHRILMRSGVFMYPKDSRDPSKAGKLRLMYEANPMSLLVVQAGGASTNAHENILDIQPQGLHQRVSVVLGSTDEVSYVTEKHVSSNMQA
ncbi:MULTISPECIES: class 1 fructose-bisphosphatase [Vitreoscilla]|uniref:Fructose-1,6-bisphosphatase class 1 n=1 Tax=Vitreoscilla stercoraria TaxID=61 RepID=A0ABY4EBC4_VITST|nr:MULTISPECIES: class 1 fructose-bisphosphatase [Vitreoscilla]QJQ52326.1 class 1 fructose-1,6-bisphosphatase [Vitreoscilla sp. C1]UOO93053.1 class 1 fructose-bisphosphatase [Vitreoscilla stercoraria]